MMVECHVRKRKNSHESEIFCLCANSAEKKWEKKPWLVVASNVPQILTFFDFLILQFTFKWFSVSKFLWAFNNYFSSLFSFSAQTRKFLMESSAIEIFCFVAFSSCFCHLFRFSFVSFLLIIQSTNSSATETV